MKLLSEDNEEFLLFEHGSALDSMTPSGCVDHAHIHVLPLGELGLRSSDILEAFPRNLVEVGQAIDFEQLAEFSNRDYFWVSNQGLRPRLLMPRKIERQILRQIIASALSLQTYLTWDLYDIEAANVTTQNWRERRSREGLIL